MRLWAGVLDLLFPPKCPFCQKILEDSRSILCPACKSSLPWLTGRAAERKVDFSDGCFSPLAYRDRVPEAVHRYKFSGVQAYGIPFGGLLARCIQENLDERIDALTWAPLSRHRLRERGFDQAELLARAAGKELNRPVFPTLCKEKNTQPQSELEESSARRANALGAYALLPGADVRGKRLLLVDDVVTSGATLSECARVLRQSGAEKVWCAAVAQARTNG
ncbi:MAG: ComF family protein [Lawsonibacter sp.]|nr:ComF family protein [Lawsonibacter sp.]